MAWQYPLALALAIAAASALGQSKSEPPLASPPVERFIPLDVTINGAKGGTWPFFERMGVLYAPREALEEWRVQVRPNIQPVTVRGGEYWPLSAVPGFGSRINFPNQSIELTFSPQAFAATRLTTELSERPRPSKVLPSAFVNYDLNYAATQPRTGLRSSDLGLLAELGVSNDWGVLTSSHVGRNLAHSGQDNAASGWLRLETTFTRDQPERNRTLRLGDAATRMGMWGRSVYFGGVQYGSNYALTPGFITQPLPVLRGVSAAPSTVELYVNGVLRQTSNVPTGPFAIDNTSALTGNGEARLVVRDLLGREVVIVQPFFTSVQLLAGGLADWSVEAGRLRRDIGLTNANYGEGFTSGTWRYGVNEQLTVEARGEASRDLKVLGLGASAALPFDLLGKAAAAVSRDNALGQGRHWIVGLERDWLRSTLQVELQGASRGFRSLGQDVGTLPVRFQAAGNFSYSTENWGTFGLGFASINRYDEARITTISANYGLTVGKKSNLNVSLSRVLGDANGASFAVTLSVPLDNNLQVSTNVGGHGKLQDYYATASQTPAAENGLGWRALAGSLQSQAHAEGGVYYLGRYGRAYGDISASPDQTSIRTGASGGLVAADGRFFATRRVDQSFAVAEIKDFAGVGIGLGSNIMARTNARGIALLPQLVPYQNNSVRVDPKELPVSAEIDNIEQIVVPSWRSAVKVDFPVRSGRAALVKIQLDDGDVAPAGALAQIVGDKQEFYVARRGEAFVTGLQPANKVALRWNGQECVFEVNLPPAANDEIARVGPVLCKGIKR
ncbi:MAG: fimbrial biogenesis outer membrane usher protein [Burkholderiales bacterium]|nr:fimbrial biogenesis outer membrane usher protein [Burkholderiales bacterium]